jgi:hypothetical protein
MVLPTGNFISSAVYDGKLHSQHSIADSSSLAFVNVSALQGLEERAGTSWRVDILFIYFHQQLSLSLGYFTPRAYLSLTRLTVAPCSHLAL